MLGFIGSTSSLVSIDEAGHIYLWEYDLLFLKPSVSFRPKFKYRMALDVPQYRPQGNYQYNFPRQISAAKAPGQLNAGRLSREDRAAIEEYVQGVPLDWVMSEYVGVTSNKDGSFVFFAE
eukprot:TRINITY_DN6206_c0_g1_i1.p2 TRINITY_DN6206_c0_g1~~TRINITY_DN6206_c0_g1_i1.p2  ORF type:complete len:120 (-),score=37.71 TRINITY_DN6206_c0_g1_i1:837-1196(-)